MFLWDDGAAGIERFEKLCEERGLTSADVFRVNDCAPLPSTGDTLLIPNAKRDLNAAWMEVQTRKSGGSTPLVSIKLHSVPRKLRADSFSVTAGSGGAPLLTSLRSELPTDKTPPAAKAVLPVSVAPPAAKPQKAAVKNDGMTWPVDGKITSGFGRRGRRSFHSGIDIPMPKGTPILAAQDGTVLDVGTNKNKKYRGYGNVALLEHGNGVITLYAHCQSVSVKKGQPVRRGEIIGLVGSTGRSTTAHVHFEVRKDGKAVNPLPYLASR
jgi:murein DD-endopeptidase MepM/ murein hydrolase activator NlpD